MHPLILAVIAVHLQQPTLGCYRADRALGTSANSALVQGIRSPAGARIGEDSAGLPRLTTFRLLASGRVDRPEAVLRDLWQTASRWESASDTLHVALTTGTSGWDLRLVRDVEGRGVAYVGEAQYLTDVVVVGEGAGAWRPLSVPIRVHRESCPPPA
jgi:hypothetical protein